MKFKILASILAFVVTFIYGGIVDAAEVLTKKNIENENIQIKDNHVHVNSYSTSDSNIVENNYNSKDLTIESRLEHNEGTDTITADASLKDKYGNDIDKTTGDKIVYDTHKVNASVWPVVGVLVGYLAKHSIKLAIKKYGKNVVTSMIRTSPKVAVEAAKKLGYSPTKSYFHGKKVFERNKRGNPMYITPDADNHSGGAWKGASSIKKLGNKKTRSGTYDANLKRIGD
ncbi:SAR2788 family putative toxin [Staphylococcus pseudintermedius]|uniref:SAR2788 family putative toxin n=1 Tax=Staphylococcus pseudintermedius TaxID=283734 RepID=UPI001BDEA5B8|nr:SAR2788 family putative toxin [Staphylococcus pseudintermedius]